jgi:glycosyltransferase involved in cell wall biosynthesis
MISFIFVGMPLSLDLNFFILSLVSIFLFLGLVSYWIQLVRPFHTKETKNDNSNTDGVSVIICAKNASNYLRQNLDVFLTQNYPDYEVVVVNDQSDDDTYEVLQEFSLKYPHLKIVEIKEHIREFKGKKFAIMLGIKAAKNEILLLSDADCVPNSKNWVQSMANGYNKNSKIVLGLSPHKNTKGLLGYLVSYDTFYTGINYIGSALRGIPYMGVGRNLSYKKSFFFENKGFYPYLNIPFGDDDLLVNGHSTKENTEVVISRDSFVLTESKKTISDWFKQKTRHISAGVFYKNKDKNRLGLFYTSQIVFFVSVIVATFILTDLLWVLLVLVVFRILMVTLLNILPIKKLNETKLYGLSGVLDVFWNCIFLPYLTLHSLIFRKKIRKRW